MQMMKLNQAVEVFLTYCKARSLAHRMVQTYTSSPRRLWEFLVSTDGNLGISSPDQREAHAKASPVDRLFAGH